MHVWQTIFFSWTTGYSSGITNSNFCFDFYLFLVSSEIEARARLSIIMFLLQASAALNKMWNLWVWFFSFSVFFCNLEIWENFCFSSWTSKWMKYLGVFKKWENVQENIYIIKIKGVRPHKNWNFRQKMKFCSKMEIFAKTFYLVPLVEQRCNPKGSKGLGNIKLSTILSIV